MFKSISVKNFLHTLYAEIQSLLGMRRSNKKYNKKTIWLHRWVALKLWFVNIHKKWLFINNHFLLDWYKKWIQLNV